MKDKILFLLVLGSIMLTGIHRAHACGDIEPGERLSKIVRRLAYPDFPKAADIFAIIRIESGFNPHARHRSKKEDSRGLMQVQHGPWPERENLAMGVSILRENFKRFGTREAAVKSYNLGTGAYSRGEYKNAAARYFAKFKKAHAKYLLCL